MHKKCVGCDTPIPSGAIKCPMCGAPVQANHPIKFQSLEDKQKSDFKEIQLNVKGDYMAENIKFCTDCGNQLNIKAELCPKCGVRQRIKNEGKNKITAGVLALIIGGFGIHHFYLGNTIRGVIYLLLCWTFVPAIIAFIEGIIYLTASDDTFRVKYAND